MADSSVDSDLLLSYPCSDFYQGSGKSFKIYSKKFSKLIVWTYHSSANYMYTILMGIAETHLFCLITRKKFQSFDWNYSSTIAMISSQYEAGGASNQGAVFLTTLTKMTIWWRHLSSFWHNGLPSVMFHNALPLLNMTMTKTLDIIKKITPS